MTDPGSLMEAFRKIRSSLDERNADALEALRDRLGRDGLSMDEWNVLTQVVCDLRVNAELTRQGIR